MLLLVRHGQTHANAAGLLLGRADPPLSALGRQQAAMLATRIPPGARVISSPLRRARETAAAFRRRDPDVDDRWIELDYGTLDGRAPAEVAPAVWQRWRSDPTFVPAGGESLVDLGERVRAACTELAGVARDHDVVVVSHVSPIKAAIAWVLGTGDELAWRLFVEVASIARVLVDDHGPSLRSLNERANGPSASA